MTPLSICYIIDARSAIAQGWIKHFLKSEHEIHIISTRPVNIDDLPGAASVHFIPIGLTRFASKKAGTSVSDISAHSNLLKLLQMIRTSKLSPLAFQIIESVSALDVYRQAPKVRALVEHIQPDIVHAMRIPFEGILAAKAVPPQFPLIVSVWGNDFTLFARSMRLIDHQTRMAMRRVTALHADCQRDLDIAEQWDFDPQKPQLLAPTGGGIPADIFAPKNPPESLRAELNIPREAPIVLNPRGIRQYTRTDMFFRAIPLVLKQRPDAIFVGVNLANNRLVETWIDEYSIGESVRLTGPVDRETMARLFQASQVMVSPSTHDGTPNSLLEGMACGCFPVVADGVESIHEWITNGENGLFFDLTDPQSQADAILKALYSEELRATASEQNQQIINERAEYNTSMKRIENFYRSLTQKAAPSN